MAKEKIRYTFSLVTQGNHKFYSLTIPSDVLSECCFVTTREESPKEGFQRVLDESRARAIADYIDNDFGTIPSSIVLSAQTDAELKVVGQGRSIEFTKTPTSFLVLDGQHRVYGFSLAKKKLRVPVIIYSGLSRSEEARLFMDINTKQKPVPSQLLLDIKSLAEREEGDEPILREIFDNFHEKDSSSLMGLMSPSKAKKGKINRTIFNAALKNALSVFKERSSEKIYENLNAYLYAVKNGFSIIGLSDKELTNSTVFKGLMTFFPTVARRVNDKFGTNYTADNYSEVMRDLWSNIKVSKIRKPGQSAREIGLMFEKAFETGFTI